MVLAEFFSFDIENEAIDPILSAKDAQLFSTCLKYGWFVSWNKLADRDINCGPSLSTLHIKILHRIPQIPMHKRPKHIHKSLIIATTRV